MNLDLDKSTWKHVAFGDVVRNINVSVKDPAAAGIERVIAMEHLDPGELKINRWGSLEDGTTFTRRVRPGQTLFGKRRAYQRKAAYAEFDAICSGDILVFEADPEQLLAEFLPFLVQSNRFYDHALGTSAGSLSPRTNWRDLASFELDLPPLDEQQRIADLLWSIEQHGLALNGASCELRTTHDAMVADLCVTYPNRIDVQAVCSAEDQAVQVGPFGGSLASRYFVESGTRVLKIQNLEGDGGWNLNYAVYVTDDHAGELARYRVRAGDVVIAAQATVGRSALADNEVAGALISQHLIRVRPNPALCLPEFLALAVRSAEFQNQIRSVKTKTTRDGLNTEDVAHFVVPDVNLNDQRQLASRSRAIHRTLANVAHEIQQLVALKTVLLREIFGGGA